MTWRRSLGLAAFCGAFVVIGVLMAIDRLAIAGLVVMIIAGALDLRWERKSSPVSDDPEQ